MQWILYLGFEVCERMYSMLLSSYIMLTLLRVTLNSFAASLLPFRQRRCPLGLSALILSFLESLLICLSFAMN
jgi:hypothetical protein